ncbi:helix-turn-helix domain-containing protein [Pasteurella oralis]|uniref:Helix-turn-helix domain-containing protein n=1 Tax=Pasteurella oralis TaxID=1071947 RepID=A0ABW4P0B7_9PAST
MLNDNQTIWVDVPYEASSHDEVTIPHDVLAIMLEQNVSLLAAWRIYRKLSQHDAAKKTGLTQSVISQAEKQNSKPQRKTCERLAKIYHCKPEQLTL